MAAATQTPMFASLLRHTTINDAPAAVRERGIAVIHVPTDEDDIWSGEDLDNFFSVEVYVRGEYVTGVTWDLRKVRDHKALESKAKALIRSVRVSEGI